MKRPLAVYVHVDTPEFANVPEKIFGNGQVQKLLVQAPDFSVFLSVC